MDNIISVFRDEVSDLLEELSRQIELLRSIDDEQERRNLLQAVMRISHNIKGAAFTVGFENVGELAHAIEDSIELVVESGLESLTRFLDVILDCIIEFSKIVNESDDSRDVSELIKRIESGVELVAPKKEKQTEPKGKKKKSLVEKNSNWLTTSSSIRVESKRLDHLMKNIGELLISHGRFSSRNRQYQDFFVEFCNAYKELPGHEQSRFNELEKSFSGILQTESNDLRAFGHLSNEMSAALKSLRMLPLQSITTSWRMAVNEAAKQLGKSVNLTVEVGDIELDKHILDVIRDPMMHLIRNAVDHGIESSEERENAGKEAIGQILIEAFLQGTSVRIDFSDDGLGIDPKKVGQAAFEKGIVAESQLSTMNDQEIKMLLFNSGFSTSGDVSRISGRGVGLDVALRNIENLGGSIEISETPKLGGTTFMITLPVSILSTKVLLLRAGESIFAVPVDEIDHAIQISNREIRKIDNSLVLKLDQKSPIRIIRLSTLVGKRAELTATSQKVVITSRAGKKLGLVVQEILSEEEFVTQQLPWNLHSLPGINGAIILADGSLALSLDMAYLHKIASFGGRVKREDRAGIDTGNVLKILVADDSLASRTLAYNILMSAGYDVTTVVDGDKAWRKLQDKEFDLLVADVRMPGMDGIELTQAVRGDPKLEKLPIILVTSLSRPEDVKKGEEAGADRYLIKGQFDYNKLIEAITELV
jgi:two-component system chemotaxis sensor kinase CheA